ncbi:hypothetical protein [Aporhodopirellula aestuarii]|uniref:Uncharacterized protein n=1 Tax=Aporhodopirellula aestuarii TaxID=2950107 RepID=A0ABT0U4B9_9BACT|nr:hypothetical protein [Aporhodopirellula aestuarii]MCM2371733.1 hypothetical protein [Aporhodopirellula aestuarii]
MNRLPCVIGLVFVFSVLSSSRPVQAGLTGENVAVIVNASSADSLSIANHYVSLRNIPPGNVIFLENVPSGSLKISLDDFRDKILRPVLEAINARGLAAQIDVIAYSAGFPTSVDISSHTRQLTDPAQRKYQTPTASINSLTYFYRWILADSPLYLGWGSNFYARGPFSRHFLNPFSGEPGERFKSAQDASEKNEFEAAAESFESLAIEYPTLHPLRILAAENWLRAENEGKAFEQVAMAVRHGWVNRRHLTDTEPLMQLFDTDNAELSAPRKQLLNRLQDVPVVSQGPVAFSSSVGWTTSGHPISLSEGAIPYMLSCVLAVVHKNGSTVEQAAQVLQRSAGADRSYPAATFGFSKTNDVRSTTRFPGTPDALAWLLCRNQSVEIFSSVLPTDRRRYVGMMLGAANLSMRNREWSFVPGAIAENLTSLGAVFDTTSQTKLTALLHAGAAISSGAVAEPYSLPPKFPTAMMYPFYAEGVTAIEAFYLTLQSPYQMLIVGDPLCQPFSRAPNDFVNIELSRPEAAPDETTGDAKPSSDAAPTISLQWQSIPDSAMTVPTGAMDIFLEGKLANRSRPATKIQANLPAGLEGAIDVRLVLVGEHPTQPRIAFSEEIVIGDESQIPRIERLRKDKTDELTVFVEGRGADQIELVHLGRVIETIDGAAGRIALPSDQIGHGPVRLRAIAQHGERRIPGRTFEFDW